MPFADPERRRQASRESARRRRAAAAGVDPGVDTEAKTSTPPGPLDPSGVLVRVGVELDRLDAARRLDPAVRARTVARLLGVALDAAKLGAAGPRDPISLAGLGDLGRLSDDELRQLGRLLEVTHG